MKWEKLYESTGYIISIVKFWRQYPIFIAQSHAETTKYKKKGNSHCPSTRIDVTMMKEYEQNEYASQ